MLDRLAQAMGVSRTLAAIVLALIILQLLLQVVALVDLARRDVVQGGRKWVWALVIVFGNLLGAIVYLAVGRKVDPGLVRSGASAAGSDAARRAVDTLYGPRDRR